MSIIKHDFYTCLMCGMKSEDFLRTQKVGCSFCYIFMEEIMTQIIGSVQDESYKHNGKKSKANLFHKFLKKIIDDEAKKNPDNVQNCKQLKKLIREYF
jgi:protein-arginine kinase activator protein McsA